MLSIARRGTYSCAPRVSQRLAPPVHRFHRSPFSAPTQTRRLSSHWTSTRHRGDYGFNVFHNSNPQHGGSYARHERRMRDDEVEDFLRSVKGWVPVHDDTVVNSHALDDVHSSRHHAPGSNIHDPHALSHHTKGLPAPRPSCHTNDACQDSNNTNTNTTTNSDSDQIHDADTRIASNDTQCERGGSFAEPPAASQLALGEEAIQRTFTFVSFDEAYRFMGRLWAFCYASDKYPHVTWHQCEITVYLYSPSFRGLSRREARVAAFLNDQYNMLKRCRRQQAQLLRAATESKEEYDGSTRDQQPQQEETKCSESLAHTHSVVPNVRLRSEGEQKVNTPAGVEYAVPCKGAKDATIEKNTALPISPGARIARQAAAALRACDEQRPTALDVVKAGKLRHWDVPAAPSQ